MPTDLPPDYKPQPIPEPAGAPPAVPSPAGGADSRDPSGRPDAGPAAGRPGAKGDVVDPPGWSEPPAGPDSDPFGVPSPAGTPSF